MDASTTTYISNGALEFHTIALIAISIFTGLTSIIVLLMKFGISKTITEMKEVWEAIKEIREKQGTLRARLPEDFLMVKSPGYDALHDGINRIESAFNQFAKDCRDGKCLAGRKKHD